MVDDASSYLQNKEEPINNDGSRIHKFNISFEDDDSHELSDFTDDIIEIDLRKSESVDPLIKVKNNVKVDPDPMKEFKITRADFLDALEHIKPAFGTNSESIERLCIDGIIEWSPVNDILKNAQPFFEQAKSPHGCGVVSILLEGPSKAGKTALAAKLALDSGFPFVKFCTPEDMIGFIEAAKCMQIIKIFDDAYKSPLSCIVIDNIERLLDYCPIGPCYSNQVLQTLLILLSNEPPFEHKLVILCTTSCCYVLEAFGMVSSFTTVLHVPNLSQPEHLINVLNYLNANSTTLYFNREEIDEIKRRIQGRNFQIGIKKLLAFVKNAVYVCHCFNLLIIFILFFSYLLDGK